MTYEEQLKIEEINRNIIKNIQENVSAEEFIEFYKTHNRKETKEKYGIRTDKQLIKILNLFNYDFSFHKALSKGKPSTQSKECRIAAAKKSAETQKRHWQEKSDLEKKAWSDKQKIAHSTEHFRTEIRRINKEYQASLSPEKKAAMRKQKSKSGKAYWASLTPEEQEAIMANRFKNGRCYAWKDSKPNLAFAALLDKYNIKYNREFCLERKRFDFIIEDSKTLIEIDPAITHNTTFSVFSTGPVDKNYHLNKTLLAEKHGYRCIHIFDWDNPEKIVSLLTKKETIYARDCEVAEVNRKLAKEFINTYHLQGYAKDQLRLGLYYKGNLVAIMTFGAPRYNKKYDYELVRYCSKYNIVGGAERLFSNFIKNHPTCTIISYCDLSKFTGYTYDKLGFSKLRDSLPTPSKHWYNFHTNKHYTDNLLRQQGFSRLIHHCDAKDDNLPTNDNKTLMYFEGFVEVYDCGQQTYVFNSPQNTSVTQ